MALFQKGRSGNPTGRPRSAAGLRATLLEKYGESAEILTDRLDRLSRSRTERVALEACKVLMAYACGNPAQSFELTGKLQHEAFQVVPPDALSRLSNDQLAALAQLNGIDPETVGDPDPA